MGIDLKAHTADRLLEGRGAHPGKAVDTANGTMPQLPDDQRSRVEALALAIREGRYSINAEQIACSILSSMVRPLFKKHASFIH